VLEHASGTAAELHRASALLVSAPGPRRVRLVAATGPAVVLGSAEAAAHVDGPRAAALGCEVVRRRSGGAAVLVGPGRCLWIDVVVPRDDPLWDDDVGRAGWWLGAAWVRALDAVGLAGASVHHGTMDRHPWSDRVCFAGLGPGEVVAGPAKVVGVAQRRTRHGALFQCAVARGPGRSWRPWDPTALLDVLAWAPGERDRAAADLAGVALEVGDDVPLGAAFLAVLPGDGAPPAG
jgi:lipoate-protein ligase A